MLSNSHVNQCKSTNTHEIKNYDVQNTWTWFFFMNFDKYTLIMKVHIVITKVKHALAT
jgi:hypothetical protein